MDDAYTLDFPPPLEAPEAAAELGTGWRLAVDMWRAHVAVVPAPENAVVVCRVCRVPAPCDMSLWLGRFLAAAAGEPVEGQGGPLPCLPEPPDGGGLRYRGRAVGRAVPSAPVEARRRLDLLPMAHADDRGWFG
jgi:hypothetical protein